MSKNLTSIPTLVESPFIEVTIGGVTFGTFTNSSSSITGRATYPNFMESLTVVKVNGAVNTYTINFTYQVAPGQDPNLLENIFSKAAKDRNIYLRYGDWNAPSYIYKEEQGIITQVTSSLDMNSSCLKYTVQCTSTAIAIDSNLYSFPGKKAKPSNVLLELLSSPKYGLQKVFTGMSDITKVIQNNLIPSNDKVVPLQTQTNITLLSYILYLVNCMISNTNTTNTPISDSTYLLSIHDDYTNKLGGTYFKISELSNDIATVNQNNSLDTYEIDINYPGDNFVTQFSVNNDQSWSILYEFSEKLDSNKYNYSYGSIDGTLNSNYSPSIVRSSSTRNISPLKSSWWTYMTQFPIKATLTIKGLMRPSMLMTYVKLNVLFNGGLKHISSGLYVITKQTDTIDSNGYKTTLELLRVGGDI